MLISRIVKITVTPAYTHSLDQSENSLMRNEDIQARMDGKVRQLTGRITLLVYSSNLIRYLLCGQIKRIQPH